MVRTHGNRASQLTMSDCPRVTFLEQLQPPATCQVSNESALICLQCCLDKMMTMVTARMFCVLIGSDVIVIC